MALPPRGTTRQRQPATSPAPHASLAPPAYAEAAEAEGGDGLAGSAVDAAWLLSTKSPMIATRVAHFSARQLTQYLRAILIGLSRSFAASPRRRLVSERA